MMTMENSPLNQSQRNNVVVDMSEISKSRGLQLESDTASFLKIDDFHQT